jgi:hypothetical protein
MRTVAFLSVVVSCVLVTSGPAGGERGLRHELTDEGLSVSYPSGWSRIGRQLTNCSDPVEVIDIGGPGAALFMLQETGTRGLPHRPKRFRLAGKPSPLECCTPTREPGWLVPFQDAGRGFYAYLYPGSLSRRDEVLAILNSLEVGPR